MWTLVFIYFYNTEPFVVKYETYESMYDCFGQREALIYDVGGKNGYFPPGQQAVCIYIDK